MRLKVVILDLDRTLWDHSDVSSTAPPFRRVDDRTIIDAEGAEIRLHECVKDFLREIRKRGVALAVASWNLPGPAEAALQALGLLKFFDVIVIEPHPYKERMIAKILKRLEARPEEAVFIDDNPDIVERVKKFYPELNVLLYWVDVNSFCGLAERLLRGGEG